METVEKDHKPLIARLERWNQGLKVVEFVPGKRLVLRRKPRINLFDLFRRLLPGGVLGGLTVGLFYKGFDWGFLVVWALIVLPVAFFVFGRPALKVWADRFVLDLEEGVSSRRFDRMRIRKRGWSRSNLLVEGEERGIWAVPGEIKPLGDSTKKVIEIWANVDGEERCLHTFIRPWKSGVEDQVDALNELLERFQEEFQRINYLED